MHVDVSVHVSIVSMCMSVYVCVNVSDMSAIVCM